MTEPNRENPVIVGCVIGILRESFGLTAEEMAERAEVSLESVNDVEQGKELPSQEWLEKVAVRLDTTREELLAMIDEMGEKGELAALLRNIALDADSTALKDLLEFAQGFVQLKESESAGDWSLRWGVHQGYITTRSDRETIHGLGSLAECRERAETLKREQRRQGYQIWFVVAVSPSGEINPFMDLKELYER